MLSILFTLLQNVSKRNPVSLVSSDETLLLWFHRHKDIAWIPSPPPTIINAFGLVTNFYANLCWQLPETETETETFGMWHRFWDPDAVGLCRPTNTSKYGRRLDLKFISQLKSSTNLTFFHPLTAFGKTVGDISLSRVSANAQSNNLKKSSWKGA